jgi:hypothetical protein
VTAYVQTLAGTGTQVSNQAQKVEFAPGQTAVQVRIPVTASGTTPGDTVYNVFVADPTGAVVGQDYAHITVQDPAPAA